MPRDGVPPVIEDPDDLAAVIDAMATRAQTPVAVDAERASGHRYGQRAFLVQLRREGAGTALIDPVALRTSRLGAAIADAEWILHAASQDLPCLAEVGMVPRLLFDTELGGRLAGFARVGLTAMVEQQLGLALAEHSMIDWSTAPLPSPGSGTPRWTSRCSPTCATPSPPSSSARASWSGPARSSPPSPPTPPPAPRVDPWRRTSGMHQVRNRRSLAAVRQLWLARDEIARERDLSPGRVLPDSAFVEAAVALPATSGALAALPGFSGHRGAALPAAVGRGGGGGPGTEGRNSAAEPALGRPAAPARVWGDRDPAAAARLAACRADVTAIAAASGLPVENLLSPDTVRRLAWTPPGPLTEAEVADALRGYGARPWQIDLTAAPLTRALQTRPRHHPPQGPTRMSTGN